MKKSACGMVLAAVMGLAVSARSDVIINVDFQPGGAGGGTSVTFASQGAVASLGNVWNATAPSTDGAFNGEFGSGGIFDFAGGSMTIASLLDSEGNATSIQLELFKGTPDSAFALNPLNGGDFNVANDAKDLMRDFLIATDPNDVNISGLIDGGLYHLYLYGAGDNSSQQTTFTVGGVSQSTTGVNGSHDLTEGVDYVVYNNVVASGGFIGINYTVADGASEGRFNGFQLVQVVPEPSTLLLTGAGYLVLAVTRRRNKAN